MKKYLKLALVSTLIALGIMVLQGAPARTQSPPVPTSTAVSSDRNPSPAGTPITFTVVVSGGGTGIPTGTVEFFSGPNSLGTAVLANVDGKATASISPQLAPGLYPILVNYYGDGTFASSISAPPLPQRIIGK